MKIIRESALTNWRDFFKENKDVVFRMEKKSDVSFEDWSTGAEGEISFNFKNLKLKCREFTIEADKVFQIPVRKAEVHHDEKKQTVTFSYHPNSTFLVVNYK